METEHEYREEVARLIARRLIGTIDEDPLVIVDEVIDTTEAAGPEVVLRLEMHTRTEHAFGHVRVYTFEDWDDYADKSAESMAAGLAVQIWSDLVDVAATGQV